MRPKPLIETRVAIQSLLCILSFWALHAPNEAHLQCAKFTCVPIGLSRVVLARCSLHDGLGGDAEELVKLLGRSTGAERLHTDEGALGADDRIPAEPHRRLDGDLDGGVPDDGVA